jgi:hypothetical protein
MTLFTLCINPLLFAFDKKVGGVRIGKSSTKTSVLAYADDINILLTKQEAIELEREILQEYAELSGRK